MISGRYDLPLERDAIGRSLPWMLGLMVFLASLALAGALVLANLAARWDSGLSGTLTIQVPVGTEALAASLDQRVEAALRILRATPGVRTAEPIGRQAADALLSPWLNDPALLRDLPVPALIDVRLGGGPVDIPAMTHRLAQAVPGVIVDDHQAWINNLLGLARLAEGLAVAIVLVVAATCVLAVTFVARAGLAVHASEIDLLHTIGATDGYVARQFARHALILSARGSFAGAAAAAVTILVFDLAVPAPPSLPLPAVGPDLADWAVLALVPVLAAVLSALAARITVLRALARLP